MRAFTSESCLTSTGNTVLTGTLGTISLALYTETVTPITSTFTPESIVMQSLKPYDFTVQYSCSPSSDSYSIETQQFPSINYIQGSPDNFIDIVRP